MKLVVFPKVKMGVSSDVALTVLAIFSVAMVVFEIIAESGLINSFYLLAVDSAISLIFLLDWIRRLHDAPDKLRFIRGYWWELIAAVPVYLEPTGILRFVRLAVRLRILFERSQMFVKHAYPLEISSYFSLIMFGGADLFHAFEYGTNENVHSFFDSIWWSMVTITTVGYGDISPVTTGGRIVSMMLMMLGIGFLGLTTGVVARAIITHKERQ